MPIYLDYAASNPIDPRVRTAVEAALAMTGNPSSTHSAGRTARATVDVARKSVASLLNVDPSEIIFTSGGSESNVSALVGAFLAAKHQVPAGTRLHIISTPLEHPSVSETLARLAEDEGAVIDWLPVDKAGRVSAVDVGAALTPETVLVSVMWVNNILGSIQPIADIGALVARERGRRGKGLPILFHSDAVQAIATLPVDPAAVGVDLLSLSGHKLYGPKGIGALYLKRGLSLPSLITGGGQESGRRSGTENVPGIIGLGRAAEILVLEREADRRKGDELKLRLAAELRKRGYNLLSPEDAVPTIVYAVSQKEDGDTLALKLDVAGLSVSSGAACDSGKRTASPVLLAAFGEKIALRGGFRASFGRFTTEADIDALLNALDSLK